MLKIIFAIILTSILTLLLNFLLRKLKPKNLFKKIRGGIPRGVGAAPFITLVFFTPYPYNLFIFIIGISAFLDDIIGRVKINKLGIEWGQLSRGIGMLTIAILGYSYFGIASFLIAFMVQPLNIADMQPGKACTTIITMASIVLIMMIFKGQNYYLPLLLLVVTLAYSPLDYKGKIMMGEIGNHSFAVALGICFYLLGGPLTVLIFLFLTSAFIAFIRRKYLEKYLEEKLGIKNPTFGDYFMDVMTGGGLGDFIRRLILGKRQIKVKNPVLIFLGFRRLLYNKVVK